MNKTLKKILIGLVVFWGLFWTGGWLIPSEYGLSRSIVILAPVDSVFNQVQDLKKNPDWSPWIKTDPTNNIVWGPKTIGLNAQYSWSGKHSGEGTLVNSQIIPNQLIQQNLDFGSLGNALSVWKFASTPQGIQVTWSFKASAGNNIPRRYFGLLIDNFLGPSYEQGLVNLKAICEKKNN